VAERIVHQLIDDLDGSEIPDGGDEQIEFSVRGVAYQIDLSTADGAKFDKALRPFIDGAMKVRGGRGGGQRARTTNGSG
jgi:hypothetical protein